MDRRGAGARSEHVPEGRSVADPAPAAADREEAEAQHDPLADAAQGGRAGASLARERAAFVGRPQRRRCQPAARHRRHVPPLPHATGSQPAPAGPLLHGVYNSSKSTDAPGKLYN